MNSNSTATDELNWSDAAENVISMFYDADIMVYVEGQDDIGFWEIVFKKTSELKVEIQDVGGCEELEPYINRIISGQINAIVARDTDLNYFSSTLVEHPNIIYTKGYSIENTIIDSRVITKILKNIGRYNAKEIQSFNVLGWMDDFQEKTSDLVALDVYNHLNQCGLSVVGDSCDRFMKSKSSFELCEEKIHLFINELPSEFINNGILLKHSLSYPNNTSIFNWIRGHFLFSATLRFITKFLSQNQRKAAISNDSYYSNMLTAFELYFDEEHQDYNYYRNKISLVA
ncbi:TPA: DUF4435 domain-containing protein [Enterobacter hormaechei]